MGSTRPGKSRVAGSLRFGRHGLPRLLAMCLFDKSRADWLRGKDIKRDPPRSVVAAVGCKSSPPYDSPSRRHATTAKPRIKGNAIQGGNNVRAAMPVTK